MIKPAKGWTIATIEDEGKIILEGTGNKIVTVKNSNTFPIGSRIWTNNSQNVLEIEGDLVINDLDIIAYKESKK